MDQSRAKTVLATRLKRAYDDLFLSDKEAQTRTVERLKGWFKTKTGAGDAVAKKIATTFKSLATYSDFSQTEEENIPTMGSSVDPEPRQERDELPARIAINSREFTAGLGFVYRIEIHLPDTTNLETYRSIFRAIREELQS